MKTNLEGLESCLPDRHHLLSAGQGTKELSMEDLTGRGQQQPVGRDLLEDGLVLH